MNKIKRIGGWGLLLILLVSAVVSATPADEDKPRILINTASRVGELFGNNSLLAPLKDLVEQQGFVLEHRLQSDLSTGSPFEGIAVYALFNPNFPITDADKVALRQWVRSGGILLMGDGYIEVVMDAFAMEFGVAHGVYREFELGKTLELPPNSPLAGPLPVGDTVTSYYRTLMIVDDTRAEAMLKDDEGNPVITRTISFAGKGMIITFGCPYILLDRFKSEPGLDNEENYKLVQNLFTLIRNKLNENSYDLNLLKVKSKGGSSFLPGDEIKFVAKIKNIGAINSEVTNIVFYLENKGPASDISYEIASSKVPVVKTKKKTKIAKTIFLPDDLLPGTYDVVAVIDPDGETGDADAGNNKAVAKKKIIIE